VVIQPATASHVTLWHKFAVLLLGQTIAVLTQAPVVGLQESVVHTFLSLQEFGDEVHPILGSQVKVRQRLFVVFKKFAGGHWIGV
jgi:hypothetical protein